MNLRKKRTSLWKWLAVTAAAISFVVVFSCNTPFIPIPPPDPSFTQDPSSGDWSVSTAADSRAVGSIYFVYNADLGSGIIQRAETNGSIYARALQGSVGDRILIHWEKSANDQSATICRPLGNGLVLHGCQ